MPVPSISLMKLMTYILKSVWINDIYLEKLETLKLIEKCIFYHG